MAEDSIDLVQQLRAHLASLQSSGLLFVPRGAAITPLKIVRSEVPANSPKAATPVPEASADLRRRELTVVSTEVASCDRCSELFSSRTQPVFGAGPLDAEVAFVGDAPGPEEDAQREPFVGKGGQLLGRVITACGLSRDQVYLMTTIKCRTPKKRPPTQEECGNCRDFFRRQIEIVKPKHLVALGQFAARILTGRSDALAELRGTVHQYCGVPLICTHNPDDVESDTKGYLRRETWEDMKMLLRTMGREVPTYN